MAELNQDSNGESEQTVEQEETPYEKTEQFEKLVAAGISEEVAEELDKKLYATELLSDGDLDSKALDALKDFDLEGAKLVIDEFSKSKLKHVVNKSAYLCGVMKIQRQKHSNGRTQDPQKGPDEAKLNAILERTGYSLDVTTGQRKYGGPPPNWGEAPQPGAGHVVFVGKIPKDMFEDELIPLFEESGEIWEFRLMMDPVTKLNKGYGFVTFCTKEAAKAAEEKLNGYEVPNGNKLKVNISVANVRIFVGNIPKTKSKEEIHEEFGKIVEELVEVIVYPDSNDESGKRKNRGFAFLEFTTHKGASSAKRKLGSGRIKVWGQDLVVEWADQQTEPDEETMSKVKILFVSMLSSDVTEEMLKTQFEEYGTVERVRKPQQKPYGFVHFAEREHALNAMKDLNGQKLGQLEIQVSLAKPQLADAKKKEERRMRGSGRGGFFRGQFGGPAYGGFGGGMRPAYFDDYYRGHMDYQGGYNDYDNFYGYNDFYGRGRGRGGPGGRGGPRGGRGMQRGRGMMGGNGFRGGRGGPRGGGMARGGAVGGMGVRGGKQESWYWW